jgi:hypothetical protein
LSGSYTVDASGGVRKIGMVEGRGLEPLAS